MARVLVWTQYGTPKVFKAETPMDFFKIAEKLREDLKIWAVESQLNRLFAKMNQAMSGHDCEKVFMDFVRIHIGSHELLETFQFVYTEE